jgi:hypothetical protein
MTWNPCGACAHDPTDAANGLRILECLAHLPLLCPPSMRGVTSVFLVEADKCSQHRSLLRLIYHTLRGISLLDDFLNPDSRSPI